MNDLFGFLLGPLKALPATIVTIPAPVRHGGPQSDTAAAFFRRLFPSGGPRGVLRDGWMFQLDIAAVKQFVQ
jgi:hypothetical protein